MEILRIVSFRKALPALTSRTKWDAYRAECVRLRAVPGARKALRAADKDLNLLRRDERGARRDLDSAQLDRKVKRSEKRAAREEVKTVGQSRRDLQAKYLKMSDAFPVLPEHALAVVYAAVLLLLGFLGTLWGTLALVAVVAHAVFLFRPGQGKVASGESSPAADDIDFPIDNHDTNRG